MLYRRFAELGDGQGQGRRRLADGDGQHQRPGGGVPGGYRLHYPDGNAWLDEDAKRKADQQGICVLGAEENSYRLALQIGRLLS